MEFKDDSDKDKDNIRAIVRVRPASNKEKSPSIIKISEDRKSLALLEYFSNDSSNYFINNFNFDYIFDEKSTQKDIYDNVVKQTIYSALEVGRK